MKKIVFFLVFFKAFASFAQEAPKVLKSEFSQKALAQKMTTLKGKEISVKDILHQNKGHIVILDFWASWCQDCLIALPKTKALMKKNPSVKFIYFSLDRNEAQWKKGLEKYHIEGPQNYWFKSGWKNDFNTYIDLNWIPRFMVIDQKGKIAKYYAITPDDPELESTLNELTNHH